MSELPQDWESATLRHVALPGRQAFTDGDWIEAPYITNSGIRLIQTGNIGSGEFLDKSNSQKFVSKSTFQELACKWIRKGDVLVCRLADPIGRACEVPEELDCSITSVDVTILKVNEREFDPRYVLHWLNSKRNLKNAADRAGGSTRSRISRSNLGRLPIPHPPLQQQRKIARILDTLDTKIRQTAALITKLERISQGLLTDLLTRGIDQTGQLRSTPRQDPRLYKDSPLGRIPKEWDSVRLGDLVTEAYRYPSYYGIDYVASGVPEVRGELINKTGRLNTDLDEYRYISEGTASRFSRVRLKPGDIVMTVRGTIGKFALVENWLTGAVITANLLKISLEKKKASPTWLIEMLLSDEFQHRLELACSSTTIATIQVPELASISIALPTIDEQQKISARILTLKKQLRVEKERMQKMHAQKFGLMDDLLTGRVRVTPLLETKERATA